MKSKTYAYLALLIGCFAACRQEATPEVLTESQPSFQEPAAIHVFNGAFKNFDFHGRIPDEISYVSDVQHRLDNATGAAQITIGKEYTLQIKEYHVDLADLRKELAENSVFEHVFFDEGDDSFFYEIVMPDGHSAGHHFVKLIDLEDHRLLIRTAENIDYGYFTAHLAAKTINSMRFKQKAAAK